MKITISPTWGNISVGASIVIENEDDDEERIRLMFLKPDEVLAIAQILREGADKLEAFVKENAI